MSPRPVKSGWSFSATPIDRVDTRTRFCRECGGELGTVAFEGRVLDWRGWIMHKAGGFCSKPCVEAWAKALGAVVDHEPLRTR